MVNVKPMEEEGAGRGEEMEVAATEGVGAEALREEGGGVGADAGDGG